MIENTAHPLLRWPACIPYRGEPDLGLVTFPQGTGLLSFNRSFLVSRHAMAREDVIRCGKQVFRNRRKSGAPLRRTDGTCGCIRTGQLCRGVPYPTKSRSLTSRSSNRYFSISFSVLLALACANGWKLCVWLL